MPISNYPNGFANGVNIRGVPLLNAYSGNVLWVDSGAGSDGNKGTFDRPFATVDYAVGQCTANNGDIIMVKPGHVEDFDDTTTGFDADVAGVAIIGMGTGSDRPRFDLNDATSTLVLGANNVTLKNVVVRPSVTVVAIGITLESGVTGCTIEDVEIAMGEAGDGTDECVKAISLVSGNHDTVIANTKIFAHASCNGATHGIHIDAASDRLVLDNVIIDGPYSTAGILEDAAGLNHIVVNCSIDTTGTDYNLHASSTFAKRTGNLTAGALENFGNASPGIAQVAIKNQALDDTDDLFDINTGRVLCHALYATCEVDGTGSPVVSLLLDADDGVNEVLATGLNIAAVNTDDTITITNGAVAINDAGADTAVMSPIVLKAGVVESVLDSGTSGNGVLKWHLVWTPLDAGATVTDAA